MIITAKKINRILVFAFCAIFTFQACNKKGKTNEKGVSVLVMDSTSVAPFFKEYPDLKHYEKDYNEIYSYYDHHYIWFNNKGMQDFGEALYEKAKNINEEGIYAEFPYQDKIDEIYARKIKNPDEHPDADLLMTGLYLFYMDHVYQGVAGRNLKDTGWLLPRKDVDETEALQTLIADETLEEDDSLMFAQYYKLRDVLKNYQELEKNGGWNKIDFGNKKSFKPGDQGPAILQIRNRLAVTGEIKNNNGSDKYDDELKNGIVEFQRRNGFNRDSIINTEHFAALNIPVQDYIKKIVVNMERCRWLPADFVKADEAILVNIPAYHMDFYENGKVTFDSDVVVGSQLHETVIFSGEMSYIAFSPYWNIPQSIINNEVKPGMEKDKKYLEKRNMEWNDGQVRQLPGGNNSLGLVKFMFPNENNIYLHDTPAKSLFGAEDRARSHGCIRVAKARDLAVKILEDDKEWTPKKIDAAMHAGKESTYSLKKKIPVYIGYFTAWVDEDNNVNFFKDVYKRDSKLAELLF